MHNMLSAINTIEHRTTCHLPILIQVVVQQTKESVSNQILQEATMECLKRHQRLVTLLSFSHLVIFFFHNGLNMT